MPRAPPPLPGLLVVRRLGFLPRLLRRAPPSLQASLQCWPAWQARLVADLTLLRDMSSQLSELPHPSASLRLWLAFVAQHPAQWKQYAKRAQGAIAARSWTAYASSARDHGGRGDLGPSQADETTPRCPECNRYFKSEQGLRMRRVRRRGYASEAARRVRGPCCPACLLYCHTAPRVAVHLDKGSPACLAAVLCNPEPEVESPYEASRASRRAPPAKTGPQALPPLRRRPAVWAEGPLPEWGVDRGRR
eukprot:2458849-Alexandrium_andersonii.AAC.1